MEGLRARLIMEKPERFGAPVTRKPSSVDSIFMGVYCYVLCHTIYHSSPLHPFSDTSRSPYSYELNGQHYFFVSRQKMERDIQNNQFVEHGYLDGDYYGTSVNSIRDVTNSGKTCLLVLIPAVSVTFQQLGSSLS